MKPIVGVVQQMLNAQVARYEKVVGGLPQEGLNWRPGNDATNSVAQLVRHVAAVQEMLLDRALDGSPEYDHAYSLRNDPATGTELLGLLARAKARKDDQLARVDAMDMAEMMDNGQAPRAYFVIHAARHGQEHLGHAELTKQLWEQRGG